MMLLLFLLLMTYKIDCTDVPQEEIRLYSGPIPHSLYHSQNNAGQYIYGYATDISSKEESRSADGVTRGGYSYIDANGILQTIHYVSDPVHGFRVAATNIPHDVPEVARARAQHLAAFEYIRAEHAHIAASRGQLPIIVSPLPQAGSYVAPIRVASTLPATPAVVTAPSQYHAQDNHGQYSYGYAGPHSAKTETKSADGVTRGGYTYIDANGLVQSIQYISDPVHGFRVRGTNLPEALDVEIIGPKDSAVISGPKEIEPIVVKEAAVEVPVVPIAVQGVPIAKPALVLNQPNVVPYVPNEQILVNSQLPIPISIQNQQPPILLNNPNQNIPLQQPILENLQPQNLNLNIPPLQQAVNFPNIPIDLNGHNLDRVNQPANILINPDQIGLVHPNQNRIMPVVNQNPVQIGQLPSINRNYDQGILRNVNPDQVILNQNPNPNTNLNPIVLEGRRQQISLYPSSGGAGGVINHGAAIVQTPAASQKGLPYRLEDGRGVMAGGSGLALFAPRNQQVYQTPVNNNGDGGTLRRQQQTLFTEASPSREEASAHITGPTGYYTQNTQY